MLAKSIITNGFSQDPPQQVIDDCTREVDEVLRLALPCFCAIGLSIITSRYRRRVLRKGNGTFFYLTFGQPHFRKRYLTQPDTTLEIQQIGDAFHYYLYILRT